MNEFFGDFYRERNDRVQRFANNIAVRIEQEIRVVIKPRPKFIPEKLWLKLASVFIYIEKTTPSMSIKED